MISDESGTVTFRKRWPRIVWPAYRTLPERPDPSPGASGAEQLGSGRQIARGHPVRRRAESETVTVFDPGADRAFLTALTQVDLGEADLIVTPSAEVAQWAERRGYRIVRDAQDGMPIYEIWGGPRP